MQCASANSEAATAINRSRRQLRRCRRFQLVITSRITHGAAVVAAPAAAAEGMLRSFRGILEAQQLFSVCVHPAPGFSYHKPDRFSGIKSPTGCRRGTIAQLGSRSRVHTPACTVCRLACSTSGCTFESAACTNSTADVLSAEQNLLDIAQMRWGHHSMTAAMRILLAAALVDPANQQASMSTRQRYCCIRHFSCGRSTWGSPTCACPPARWVRI